MYTITDFINKVFDGLELEEEQKNALIGVYLVAFYKSTLEILMGMKAKDIKFLLSLNTYFDSIINSLTEDDKKLFDKMLSVEKARILEEIVIKFSENLDEDVKQKIEKNLANFLPSPV